MQISLTLRLQKAEYFGTGFNGSGNIIGEEIGYSVNGTVIDLYVTSNMPK